MIIGNNSLHLMHSMQPNNNNKVSTVAPDGMERQLAHEPPKFVWTENCKGAFSLGRGLVSCVEVGLSAVCPGASIPRGVPGA